MAELDPTRKYEAFGRRRYDAASTERVENLFSYLKTKWGVKFSEFDMASHDYTWTVRCMSALSVGETVFMERTTERGSEKFALTHDWPKLTISTETGEHKMLASKEERFLLHDILDEIVVNDLAPMPIPQQVINND